MSTFSVCGTCRNDSSAPSRPRPNVRKPLPLLYVQHFGAHEWGIVCRTYSNTVREECKLTPGLKWNKSKSAWCGYLDAIDAAAQRILAKRIKLDTSALPKPQNPNGAILIPPLALEDLRDYQKHGVEFAVAHADEGVLIADDLGLGKSLQAIRTARALRGKTIIVVPAFLRSVWLKAIFGDKMVNPPTPVGWPHVKVQLLYGVKPVQKNVYDVAPRTKQAKNNSPFEETHQTKNDSPAAIDPNTMIVILNYEIVYAWLDVLTAWGATTLIGDEAHMLSGDRSRRTRSVEALAKTCAHRVLLSGTPMLNRPRDLWGPINILSPWRFGHPHHFHLRHCGAYQHEVAKDTIVWNTKGASNLDELRRRLSFFMIRRTKSDVAMQLPPRTRQILELDVDRRFVVAIAAALKSDSALQNALGMAADGKLPDVANLVVGHVRAGSKVVVGTWRKVIAETLHDAFVQADIDSALITGEISHAKREEIIKREPQVVCATIDSIGVGVDMSYASVGVCAELSYVPSKLIQWEGRLFRFRQKNPTLFQYPIARGTADELIRDVLVSKLDVFEKGVGKTDDKLIADLEGKERNPVEVLQDLYSRICKQREAQE